MVAGLKKERIASCQRAMLGWSPHAVPGGQTPHSSLLTAVKLPPLSEPPGKLTVAPAGSGTVNLPSPSQPILMRTIGVLTCTLYVADVTCGGGQGRTHAMLASNRFGDCAHCFG